MKENYKLKGNGSDTHASSGGSLTGISVVDRAYREHKNFIPKRQQDEREHLQMESEDKNILHAKMQVSIYYNLDYNQKTLNCRDKSRI